MKSIKLTRKDYDLVRDCSSIAAANIVLLRKHYRKRLFTLTPDPDDLGMNRFIVNGDTRIEVGDKTITIEELPQDSLPGQNPKLRHWKRNLARGAAPETEFLAFRAASSAPDREYRYLVSKELFGLDSSTWRAGENALERAKELFRQSLPGLVDEKGNRCIPDGEYDIAWERGLFACADFALYYGERPSRL